MSNTAENINPETAAAAQAAAEAAAVDTPAAPAAPVQKKSLFKSKTFWGVTALLAGVIGAGVALYITGGSAAEAVADAADAATDATDAA